MPLNEVNATGPREASQNRESGVEQERKAENQVSLSTLQYVYLRDITQNPIVQVAEICNQLYGVRRVTDPVELWDLHESFPLLDWSRDRSRDQQRTAAALNALDRLGSLQCEVPNEAWFSVFVLIEKLEPSRYLKAFDESMARARKHGDAWVLAVLDQWAHTRCAYAVVASVRRRTLDMVKPMWEQKETRIKQALVLDVAMRRQEWMVNPSPKEAAAARTARIADWQGARALLPPASQEQQDFGDGESMLAATLMDAVNLNWLEVSAADAANYRNQLRDVIGGVQRAQKILAAGKATLLKQFAARPDRQQSPEGIRYQQRTTEHFVAKERQAWEREAARPPIVPFD